MLADQNHRRFSIDKNPCVVDKAFPSHHRRKYKYYGDPNDSDSDIRRNLLWQGIRRLLPKLIVGSKASTIRHYFGYMLLAALEASQSVKHFRSSGRNPAPVQRQTPQKGRNERLQFNFSIYQRRRALA
jgi:hypothetical protein